MKKNNNHRQWQSNLMLEELEPRQLFSGGLEGMVVVDDELLLDGGIYSAINTENNQSLENEHNLQNKGELVTEYKELVFIDTDVENYQQLLNNILAQENEDRKIKVILLNNQRDGIAQISETLANYDSLDAVHLISHGSDGKVEVGNTYLDTEFLNNNLLAISDWAEAFAENGDFLIYGCNLAATAEGQRLVDALSQLTQTDVAVSDDLTGSTELGGDWDLEYQTGVVETNVIITPALNLSWVGVLDTITGLVGHWAFDEGSGSTTTDSSGNSNNGVLLNSPTYAGGKVGSHALDFGGDYDRVEIPDIPSLDFGSGDFSVSFWFNSSQVVSSGHRLIGDMNSGTGFIIFRDSNGLKFQVTGIGDTSIILASSGNGSFDGNWHHVVVTRSNDDFQLYVDNTSEGTDTKAVGNINSPDTLRIGASSASSGDFDGLMDDVRLYNRALTKNDIAQLYAINNAPTNITLQETTQVTITNPGFEALTLPEGNWAALISGWVLSGNTGVWNVDTPGFENEAPEGQNIAYLDESSTGNTFSQVLTETFQVNRSYTLSAMVGDENDNNYDPTGWEMRLYAGDQLLGSVNNNDVDPAEGEFKKATLHLDADTLASFSAQYGQALKIEFYNQGTTLGEDVHFDDVQLEYTSISVNENASNGTVVADIANVTDPDAGDTHTYSLVDTAVGRFVIDPNTGEISVANGSLLDYESNTSHNITVRATDVGGLTYDELVTVNVTNVNDAPVLAGGSFNLTTITEDEINNNGNTVAEIITSAGGDKITDVDAGAVEGIAIIGQTGGPTIEFSLDNGASWSSAGGMSWSQSLLLRGTDRVRFVPDLAKGSTVQQFQFRAWDQASGTAGTKADANNYGGTTAFSSATAWATIDITDINDAPVNTVPGSITVTEDVASALTGISITDVDAGSSPVVVTFSVPAGMLAASFGTNVTVGGTATNLTLTGKISDINNFIAANNVTYTPAANANGSVTLTVQTSDQGNTGSGGALTDSDSVTLDITAVNDNPTVEAVIATQNLSEDFTSYTLDLKAAFADVETTDANLSYSVSGDSNINVSINSGVATISSTAHWNGSETLTFTATDAGGLSVSQDVDFNVVAVNDAPTVANPIANQSAAEDSPFTFTFAANTFNDVDVGDSLHYSSDVSGWLSFNADTRTFSGIPANGDVGTTTVTVTATDGSGDTISEAFLIFVKASKETDPTDFFGILPEDGGNSKGKKGVSNIITNNLKPHTTNSSDVEIKKIYGEPTETNRIEISSISDLFTSVGQYRDEESGYFETDRYSRHKYNSHRVILSSAMLQDAYIFDGGKDEEDIKDNDLIISHDLWKNIELMRSQLDFSDEFNKSSGVKVEYIAVASVGFSVGFVSWILRGGSLMASFLSSVPLFREFDPLPIITSKKKSKLAEKVKSGQDEREKISADSMFE
jgi:hypothetical protein